MSNITNLMGLGKRSLSNSQSQLNTTAHNVANTNTEGYSRQRVEMVTEDPVIKGGKTFGQGAKAKVVTRVTNDFLTRQIQDETTRLGYSSGRNNAMERVEQIFNESINKGLNQFASNFFNAFREFSNNPESQGARALVKEAGAQLSGDFQRIHTQLKAVQSDVDFQVHSQVQQVNGYIREIADLNETITKIEVGGAKANDARDRRELVVKRLGEIANINYGESKNGKLSVTMGRTAVLVSGGEFREVTARNAPARGAKREGNADILYKPNPYSLTEFVITDEINNGVLGGVIETRDKTINELHDKLDEMAYTISTAVNSLHMRGFDKYNQTGVLFFEPMAEKAGAAGRIAVSEDVLRDPGKIANAIKPNSPGDNRLANAISQIQTAQLFNNGTTSADEFYNGLVGEFAVQKQKNGSVLEHQTNVVKQLGNMRESISGVNMDEETTDMISFQKAFDASARLIRVADEMFETVLSLKRM